MSIMVTEVYRALVDAGASEEKARAAAEAIPDMSDLAHKNDIAELRSELKQDIAELRSEFKQDIVGLKADLYKHMWLMQGATIVAIVGLLKLLP
ncbi:MAG: hypothetical protein OXI92_16630 [Acidobacteriota bacterium]|nr:hypothetical protein [Acidobacteriota bacterium]